MTSRQRIFEIIERSKPNDKTGFAYDIIMITSILLGVFPLMFREQNIIFRGFEISACTVFIIDYILRWVTADFRSNAQGLKPFLLYPLTFSAIFDLLTILPVLNILNRAFIGLRVARLLRISRALRVLRYSKEVNLLITVLRKESRILLSVLFLAVFYIFITALIMFNAEDSFTNFFDSLYWATTALTTVGYGDICPNTNIGRLISMLSSLFGVAIIALPSGIITAGYLQEIKNTKIK